jgi:two-component system, NarL family, sensor histidine kinase UhpB
MRRRDLLTQVLVLNLMLVVAAVVAAIVAANPNVNLSDTPEAGLVLGFAIAFTILFNVFLLGRRFKPLEDLVDQMERADLSRPGANLNQGEPPGGPEEVERLHSAFVRMLERLEAERRRASSAALDAQEEERARIARDLHDEVNQSLTGLLLRLEAAREKAPPQLAGELAEIRALANQALRELLTLARQLRPTALDDLGLKAALASHVTDLGRQSGIETSFESSGDIASVPQDVQVVAYRVAQEALSNAARHSGAAHVRVSLDREDGSVQLRVADDGRGFTFDQASRGLGLAGMRERALLVNGDLKVESRPQIGTSVRLVVPIREIDGLSQDRG